LERHGSKVVPKASQDISVISFTANIIWNQSPPSVESTTVLKNNNPTEGTTVLIGIPYLPYKSMRISKPEIYVDGQKLGVDEAKARTSETEGDSEPYISWYTWEIELEPGEKKAFECSFFISPEVGEYGKESIKLPLDLLGNWKQPVVKAVVTADLANPYAYDFESSLSPQTIEQRSIQWFMKNMSVFSDIVLHKENVEESVFKYLTDIGNDDISEMAKCFKNKQISSLLTEAENYLNEHPSTKNKNEIMFLMSQAYILTGQNQDALTIMDQILDNPGFGEFEPLVKRKLVYDKYILMKESGNITSFLGDGLPQDNALFNAWFQELSERMENTDQEEPVPAETPVVQTVTENDVQDKQLIKSIHVAGLDVPVEVIFLLIFVFIGYTVYTVIRRRRRHYYRYYNYRYYKRKKRWFHIRPY